MFKESKQIETNINKIKNTIELNKINENQELVELKLVFWDESTNRKEYLENSERAKNYQKVVLIFKRMN